MHVLVLGAGVIGVTTAYYLQQKGYKVTVIERQPASALETSYANGCQLSYSHAKPWANPQAVRPIISSIGRSKSPFRVGLRFDPRFMKWGAQFLNHCRQSKTRYNTEQILHLALHSRACMHALQQELSLSFHYQQTGILHVYRREKYLHQAVSNAMFQQRLGCPHEVLDIRGCVQKEPALKDRKRSIVGGVYFPMDAMGDVFEFTRELADYCKAKGVEFLYNTEVTKLVREGDVLSHIETSQGIIGADHMVVALGAHSMPLLRKVGITLPIYPMKGYSFSTLLENPGDGPAMGITDPRYKLVYSRLGDDVVRVAGMAAFEGYNIKANPKHLRYFKKAVMSLFPNMSLEDSDPWVGLRPATPNGLPIIGSTPITNCWLNTGHSTLGWTLACGSSHLLADIIAGNEPECQFQNQV